MPQISVLMTVFNGMPYLKDSIQSVLNQSHTDFQFVIVDDGSTDATVAYLDSLNDPRVTICRQSNQGTAAAANQGLKLIDTDFVARMDADDVAMPDRLEKQLAFMLNHPAVGIVGSQVAPIGESGVGKSLNLPQTHESIFETMMAGRHGLAHSSIMIRTSVLKQLGGYWQLPLIDDWDMMLRMGENSELANLPDVLLNYRVHSGSLNGSSMWRMHRHISFAIDRAKRRQNGETEISFKDFEDSLSNRPLRHRLAEKMHVFAMTHYRLAVADIHGGRKIKGYARLVWSAICSPSRTIHRIGRIFKSKTNSSSNESLKRTIASNSA
ncbi:MAG: glycosyltransferase family 2 protein [Mariniblastus sp.]